MTQPVPLELIKVLSPSSKRALQVAEAIRNQLLHGELLTEHLLIGLNEKKGGLTNNMLTAFGYGEGQQLFQDLARWRNWTFGKEPSIVPARMDDPHLAELSYSDELLQVLDEGREAARRKTSRDGTIRARHLLTGLLAVEGAGATRWLVEANIPVARVREILQGTPEAANPGPEEFHTAVPDSGRTTTEVSMRAGPGEHFEAITRLAAGTAVRIMAQDRDWFRVKAEEEEGFIHRDFIAIRTDEAAADAVRDSGQFISQDAPISALAVAAAGEQTILVTAGQDGTVRRWDVGTREPIGEPIAGETGSRPVALAIGELGGKSIIVSGWTDAKVRLFDLLTGEPAGVLEYEPPQASITALLFAHLNGRPIVIASRIDGRVYRWVAATGESLGEPGGSGPAIRGLAGGVLDGRFLIVMGVDDGRIFRVDASTDELFGEALTGHRSAVSAVQVAELDGRPVIVSGSADHTVRVWDLATGEPIGNPWRGHIDSVTSLAVAQLDGHPVVISGSADQTVRFWDLKTGEPIWEPPAGHTDKVTALAAAAGDGTAVIASAGLDGTVRFWTPPDTRTERRVKDLVEWHSDAPCGEDHLNRKPLAGALAVRLRRMNEQNPRHSFLIHVDGPWGAGKTTLLCFLQDVLEPEWAVVKFDAWRQSRIEPPWWTLLAALRQQIRSGLGWWARFRLGLAETWFQVRLAGASYVLALVLVLVVATLIFLALRPETLTAESIEQMAKAVTAVVGALGLLVSGALVASKFLLWDSAKGAQLFEQSNRDPMRGAAAHFRWLVTRLGKPIVFFVDDLDRCKEEYVVELLEAIQTLVRDVASPGSAEALGPHFVVAADGAWIRKSFQLKYSNFLEAVDEPGRPLGYLFLAKLFQLTVQMPTLTGELQANYLSSLLGVEPDGDRTDVETEEEQVLQSIEASTTEAEVVAVLQKASTAVRERVAAPAVVRLNAPDVEASRTHALQKFADLQERNPRAMIRFLNAYAIARSILTLQSNPVAPDPLALWTILRLRWPAVAVYLESSPESVQYVGQPAELPDGVPGKAAGLFNPSSELDRLVHFQQGGPLTAELIQLCTGTAGS